MPKHALQTADMPVTVPPAVPSGLAAHGIGYRKCAIMDELKRLLAGVGSGWSVGPEARLAGGPLTGNILISIQVSETATAFDGWRFPLLRVTDGPDDDFEVHPVIPGGREIGDGQIIRCKDENAVVKAVLEICDMEMTLQIRGAAENAFLMFRESIVPDLGADGAEAAQDEVAEPA